MFQPTFVFGLFSKAEESAPTPPSVPSSPEAFAFSWGDATPAVMGLYTGVVVAISIVIVTPFNGVAPELSVTAPGYPTLMAAADNLPKEAGRYETNPGVRLPADTSLSLNIAPGIGASAGNGIVYLEITNESMV